MLAESPTGYTVYLYTYTTGRWAAGFVSPVVNTSEVGLGGCAPGMHGVANGGPELFIHWAGELLYSPDGGKHAHPLSLMAAERTLAAGLPPGDCIAALATSRGDSQLVATTRNGRMYWGRAAMPLLLQLRGFRSPAGAAADADAHEFDALDRLALVGVGWRYSEESPAVPVLRRFLLPLANELAGAAKHAGMPACPYVQMATDIPAHAYLDIGERLNVTVHMYPQRVADSVTAVSVSTSNFAADGVGVDIRVSESWEDSRSTIDGLVGVTQVGPP